MARCANANVQTHTHTHTRSHTPPLQRELARVRLGKPARRTAKATHKDAAARGCDGESEGAGAGADAGDAGEDSLDLVRTSSLPRIPRKPRRCPRARVMLSVILTDYNPNKVGPDGAAAVEQLAGGDSTKPHTIETLITLTTLYHSELESAELVACSEPRVYQ